MSLALVDTNVLVYRFDSRFPRKQDIATDLLRRGLAENTLRVPHQAVIEFVRAVSRPQKDGLPILPADEARREAEDLLNQFEVLYPNDAVVRTALRGAATYHLPWWDAHLWAYAECYGMDELLSEDFAHGRFYGTVRAVDPFR
jgi:predicted nucleic acid-binding protein